MKTIEISAQKRENFGKKYSKPARREGNIPCNIYGVTENVNIAVSEKELNKIIYTPESFIVIFNIEGGAQEEVVIREVQFHPVTEQILHVDFFRVINGKPVEIDIPIEVVGTSDGVKQGGKLMVSKRKLRVSAMKENLTDTLAVDITNVALGGSVFVKNLNYENITIITPANTAVLAVKMTRAARGAAAAAATK